MHDTKPVSDRHRANLDSAINRLRSVMDQKDVVRADRMARINARYVKTDRHRVLEEAFETMFRSVAGRDEDNNPNNARRRALFVVGESGSGKSTAIQRLLKSRPEFQPYMDEYGRQIAPSISFDAPKPLTMKLLARHGLEEAGYAVIGDRAEYLLWDMFKRQIKERSILYVHIDEMQHVIKGNSAKDIKNMSDVLKSFLQIKDWPVHAIFSGVPTLAKFLEHGPHKQLRNRCEVVTFERLSFPSHAESMKQIAMRIVTGHAEMEADENLSNGFEFTHRLIHAADGAFGTAIQIVRSAIGAALREESEVLSIRHFAKVYSAFSGCTSDQNVFTAAAWTEIVPDLALSSFIAAHETDDVSFGKPKRAQ